MDNKVCPLCAGDMNILLDNDTIYKCEDCETELCECEIDILMNRNH